MYLVFGQLVAAQDKAHLRAIAVGDDQVPASFDHVGDVPDRLLDSGPLGLHVLVLLVQNQRVAADGDDDTGHYSTAPRTRARRAMRITTPL